MRKKKFLAMLLTATMLCGSTMVVNADSTTISNQSGTSTSADVNSSFSIKPSDLSGLIISIPANLDLTLDTNDNYFKVADKVGAKGDLADNYLLDISLPSSLTYSNAGGSHYAAEATFQRNADLGNFHYWTPSELETAKTTPDERDISIKIASANVTNAGDYSSIASFNISIQKLWSESGLTDKGYLPSDFGSGAFTLGDGNGNSNTAIESIVSATSDGSFVIPKYVLNRVQTDTATGTWFDPSYATFDIYYATTQVKSGLLTSNTYLKTVELPNSVQTIGADAFKGCTNLTGIKYAGSIADAKNIMINTTKLGSIDFSAYSDTSSNEYILGHATWHCADGDYVPANS